MTNKGQVTLQNKWIVWSAEETRHLKYVETGHFETISHERYSLCCTRLFIRKVTEIVGSSTRAQREDQALTPVKLPHRWSITVWSEYECWFVGPLNPALQKSRGRRFPKLFDHLPGISDEAYWCLNTFPLLMCPRSPERSSWRVLQLPRPTYFKHIGIIYNTTAGRSFSKSLSDGVVRGQTLYWEIEQFCQWSGAQSPGLKPLLKVTTLHNFYTLHSD